MAQDLVGLVPLLSTPPTGTRVQQLGSNEPGDTSHKVQMGRRAGPLLLDAGGLDDKGVL